MIIKFMVVGILVIGDKVTSVTLSSHTYLKGRVLESTPYLTAVQYEGYTLIVPSVAVERDSSNENN